VRAIKSSRGCQIRAAANMALVKYSRLSVQPVTAEEWKMVCRMGEV
jgi:predicted RNA-binding protein with PUA-like domain